MNQYKNDDELDVFELLLSIWNGRWILFIFVSIAFVLGNVFLFIAEPNYSSKLKYQANIIPPFYNEEKVLLDFKLNFYSKNIFDNWKKSNVNSTLLYSDLSVVKVVDGFTLSKNKDDLFISLLPEKKDFPSLFVKSNNLSILDDCFNYANYINNLLRLEYIKRANREIKIINTRLKEFTQINTELIEKILSIDRYISSASLGADIISIQRPSIPIQTFPNNLQIIFLFIVSGGIVGISFILFRSFITKKKEQLRKG